ncbi:MAG: hypothetical protein CVV45_18305, partial [Spirochaetae bacterium HGW-Spirochaetae-10]
YENELIQVIINLLNNARDELIKIDSKDEKLIFINVLKNENNVVLEIKDNAGGIPQEIKENLLQAQLSQHGEQLKQRAKEAVSQLSDLENPGLEELSGRLEEVARLIKKIGR